MSSIKILEKLDEQHGRFTQPDGDPPSQTIARGFQSVFTRRLCPVTDLGVLSPPSPPSLVRPPKGTPQVLNWLVTSKTVFVLRLIRFVKSRHEGGYAGRTDRDVEWGERTDVTDLPVSGGSGGVTGWSTWSLGIRVGDWTWEVNVYQTVRPYWGSMVTLPLGTEIPSFVPLIPPPCVLLHHDTNSISGVRSFTHEGLVETGIVV